MEQKPFFDHFKELNQRIILSIVVLVSAFVLFYINYTDIYNLLTNPLVEAGYTKADLVAFTIYEGFQVKISNTLLVSFIGTFPITFLIIANFVKPAINDLKSSTYVIYLISFLFLFYSGLFAAYQTFPIGIKFLLQFNESEIILRTQNYFQLVSRISLIFGISFQTPLVIYFLIKKNIIKLSLFTNNRKEVFIFVLIFSAFLPFQGLRLPGKAGSGSRARGTPGGLARCRGCRKAAAVRRRLKSGRLVGRPEVMCHIVGAGIVAEYQYLLATSAGWPAGRPRPAGGGRLAAPKNGWKWLKGTNSP